MNGDFLALLPKGSFAPASASASAFEPLQATTVFAFHCADGVVIAGDHRATAGNTIFSDKTEKILELDSHSLMAIGKSRAARVRAAAWRACRKNSAVAPVRAVVCRSPSQLQLWLQYSRDRRSDPALSVFTASAETLHVRPEAASRPQVAMFF